MFVCVNVPQRAGGRLEWTVVSLLAEMIPVDPTPTVTDWPWFEYVSTFPGSLGSFHTTPHPTPARWSQGLFSVAFSPSVWGRPENGQFHVPWMVTSMVPSGSMNAVFPGAFCAGSGELA